MNKEGLKNLIKDVDSQLYDLLSNIVCSICQELLTKPVTTPCRHSFCNGCIKRVVSSKDNNGCPLCKNPLSRYGLEEDKVKSSLRRICQELPNAFADDVKELTADYKDFSEDVIKTSKLSRYKQDSPKNGREKVTSRKSVKVTNKTTAKVKENDSGSFTPVLKRSKKIQEYASAKRKRMDDLVSISQTEPASSPSIGETTDLDKKLQKIEKIPPEEKVKEWFNAVGDNIYLNSSGSECDKKEMEKSAMFRRDYNKEEKKTDPYEFIPSQNTRKKGRKTSGRKGGKKIPDFKALQSFSKESIRRTKIAQENAEEVRDEEGESAVEEKRTTASQKFDQLMSETKQKTHVLYSASLSSSPNFLDVSMHSKVEKKSPEKLDDILFKDVVEERGKRKRLVTPRTRRKSVNGRKKQTKLGELLHELATDDVIYAGQPADAPVRLEEAKVEKSEKLNLISQKSALIGFDLQEECLDEVMFKEMVANMERELNIEQEGKGKSFVAFNLLGKIRKTKGAFIEFFQLGSLTPSRTRTRSTVVKVVFPIGLSSLARRSRRTIKREISTGIQTSQRMVSSVVQTSQVEHSTATIQTSQQIKPSVEIQTSQKCTTVEIQTTQRRKSCEVQTTQTGCSAQVQTTQVRHSCEVQTTQIGEIQTTQSERFTPRKPVQEHRKVISQATSPNELFSNDEDLEMEFNKTWRRTQKQEMKDDSDDSDIQPHKKTIRPLSPESLTPVDVIEKFETPQKIPLEVRKISDEEKIEVIDLGTPKFSEGSQNSEEQMLRVLKNIHLDLSKCKKDETKGEKSEESDSDFFVEQTPPKTQRVELRKNPENEEGIPKGFSESFLLLTVPEKPDENDQNQLNANRETETKNAQLKAVVEAWKRSEPKGGKKLCVVASSVKNPEMIRKFVSKFKLEYSNKPTKDMTHLIVGLHANEEKEELPLCTPKLLFAMANKKWVVSEQWAEACMKMNVILPEENFETLDPVGGCGCKNARLSTEKLLKNCEIYLLGGFQTISKDEFADLIVDCGGTLVPSPEKFTHMPSRLRMIIADHDCLKMDENEIREMFEKHSTVVLSRDIIIMSIQRYKLPNFSRYLLHLASEKTLVKLGYPPALARYEEDEA